MPSRSCTWEGRRMVVVGVTTAHNCHGNALTFLWVQSLNNDSTAFILACNTVLWLVDRQFVQRGFWKVVIHHMIRKKCKNKKYESAIGQAGKRNLKAYGERKKIHRLPNNFCRALWLHIPLLHLYEYVQVCLCLTNQTPSSYTALRNQPSHSQYTRWKFLSSGGSVPLQKSYLGEKKKMSRDFKAKREI